MFCRRATAAHMQAAVPSIRNFAMASPVNAARNHKIVVVGGGSAGLAISHQLLKSGKFAAHDIAIVDPAEWHHYQPGWTLVGGGLKDKEELRRPLNQLLDSKLKLYSQSVDTFSPEQNFVTLANGDRLGYDQLIVAPGLTVSPGSIKGLPEALANPDAPVSSIFTYDSVSKVFPSIEKLKKGSAIFTQPAGVIKCAGAPQKIMWLALDYWKRAGLYNPANPSSSAINISFATGLPVMFGVPKYNAALTALQKERGVNALFQHDLVAVEGNKATFALPNGHALANEAGFVDVDEATTRHKKFANVWSAGDASSLPTSKTAAAVTSQAPVLTRNLLQVLEGKQPDAVYDGYTSCPLVTEYGKVLLAEFKYGPEPKETFGNWFGWDQATPRRAFYHLKKDFFPWVYFNSMVKGNWAGPKGWLK
ncbi:sulfide quinone reductase [Penicillium chermesinum]|uniref:Sulfide quinone reductase n=1 Tax=Penicillium chermesinum TaxID=63820 RepID=A0A9W9NU90_9EURO|nr:sulfide quinone reductase [Penicillium chermesinum]KAJ5225896.1 sulfide quinone reductase [Penicillium chermesinum]